MSNNPQMLPVLKNEIADEVLMDSVQAECSCPNCGTPVNKAIFADGDSLNCGACGEEMWFELRGEEVVAHRARQEQQGVSLSALLKSRQLR